MKLNQFYEEYKTYYMQVNRPPEIETESFFNLYGGKVFGLAIVTLASILFAASRTGIYFMLSELRFLSEQLEIIFGNVNVGTITFVAVILSVAIVISIEGTIAWVGFSEGKDNGASDKSLKISFYIALAISIMAGLLQSISKENELFGWSIRYVEVGQYLISSIGASILVHTLSKSIGKFLFDYDNYKLERKEIFKNATAEYQKRLEAGWKSSKQYKMFQKSINANVEQKQSVFAQDVVIGESKQKTKEKLEMYMKTNRLTINDIGRSNGVSIKKVADETGIPPNRLAVILHRMRKESSGEKQE